MIADGLRHVESEESQAPGHYEQQEEESRGWPFHHIGRGRCATNLQRGSVLGKIAHLPTGARDYRFHKEAGRH